MKIRLRACGRLLGASLLIHVVPGLKLSPAVLTLLQTPGIDHRLDGVADREDPSAASTIESFGRATWTSVEDMEKEIGEDMARDFQKGYGRDSLIRREKIRRIVLRIEPQMVFVRQGIADVLRVNTALDLLTETEVDGAIRGVDTLTSEMVLKGITWASNGVEMGELRQWLTNSVRMMDAPDLAQLVRVITGSSQPPAGYADRPWLSIDVDPVADAGCSVPTLGRLVLPRSTSQAALHAELLAAIRAPRV